MSLRWEFVTLASSQRSISIRNGFFQLIIRFHQEWATTPSTPSTAPSNAGSASLPPPGERKPRPFGQHDRNPGLVPIPAPSRLPGFRLWNALPGKCRSVSALGVWFRFTAGEMETLVLILPRVRHSDSLGASPKPTPNLSRVVGTALFSYNRRWWKDRKRMGAKWEYDSTGTTN